MRTWYRSLEGGLAVRLGVLYLVATAIAVGALLYQAYDTAASLNDRDLNLRASDLMRYLTVDPNRGLTLELPANLAAAYELSPADIFAVRAQDGRIVAASPASFAQTVAGWPTPSDDASYFRLKDFGAPPQDYYGLGITLSSAGGPVSVFVARAAEGTLLARSLLQEFIFDAAWVIPVLVIGTLATGSYAIRRSLKRVRDVSELAAAIGPTNTAVRLPEHNLPAELLPLVSAVNRALDRLAKGFAVQREFTANAAHELRTPLTIITAALDSIRGDAELVKLRGDVARMNRIVEQLLGVARLDAVGLDVSAKVDLGAVAARVVGAIAPLALAQQRSIELLPADGPVAVRGNATAIENAIRNLIENAIMHTPAHSEVSVSVERDGSITVADRGPGIDPEDRLRIFQRFWRGKAAGPAGAGLGLAIVKEIADAHNGTIQVEDNSIGPGARFTLRIPLWLEPSPNASGGRPQVPALA